MTVREVPAGVPEAAGRPYSQLCVAGPLVFVAGQTPVDADDRPVAADDVAAQTHVVLDRIEALLGLAGAGLDHVVKTTVYVAHLDDVRAMNAAYRDRFAAPFPARSTVQAGLVRPEFRVEIEAVAVLGS